MLFIPSLVAYDVFTVAALNAVGGHPVLVCTLLDHCWITAGGLNSKSLPSCGLSFHRTTTTSVPSQCKVFVGGRVYAQVAVADGKMCSITSANLTGYAMERGIEDGFQSPAAILHGCLRSIFRAVVHMNGKYGSENFMLGQYACVANLMHKPKTNFAAWAILRTGGTRGLHGNQEARSLVSRMQRCWVNDPHTRSTD
jgi:hypothetical protein